MSGVPENLGADLSAYLDGELPAERVREIEELLERDAECRAELEQLRAVRDQLAALPRHMATPELRAALGDLMGGRDRPEAVRRPPRTFRLFVRFAAAAAVLAGCALVGWEIRSSRQQRPAAPHAITAEGPTYEGQDKSRLAAVPQASNTIDELKKEVAKPSKDEQSALELWYSNDGKRDQELRRRLSSLGYIDTPAATGVTLPPGEPSDAVASRAAAEKAVVAQAPPTVDVSVRSQTAGQYRAAYAVLARNNLQAEVLREPEREQVILGGRLKSQQSQNEARVEALGDIPPLQVPVLLDELNQAVPNEVTVEVLGKEALPLEQFGSPVQRRMGVAEYQQAETAATQEYDRAGRAGGAGGSERSVAGRPSSAGGGAMGGGVVARAPARGLSTTPSAQASPRAARAKEEGGRGAIKGGFADKAPSSQPAERMDAVAGEPMPPSSGVVSSIVSSLKWLAERLPPAPPPQVRVRVVLLPPPEATSAPATTAPAAP